MKSLLAANKIDIVGLNKTKIKAHKQQEVMDKLRKDWTFIINSRCVEVGEGDSVWLGWKTKVGPLTLTRSPNSTFRQVYE